MAPQNKERKPLPKEIVKQKLRERKKLSKQLLKVKRARLLVKNLSFKATEDKLKEFFGQYGEVTGVDLLKKPDGKLLGCGFIQFKLVQNAAKAKHHTNDKEFLGRKIEVDFAKSKSKFKKEKNVEDNSTPKPNLENDVKIEIESSSENDESEDENEPTENSDTDSTANESGAENESVTVDKVDNEENNPHFSHDVSEGKTVFVKNIPFDATNEDLKMCMSQFGRIYYALVCIDKLTEHSKGTGFVKFVEKEDADKALNAGTELRLLGNVLDCHPAIDRKEVQTKMKDKMTLKKQPKDSRNLYLVKEGVIPPGSSAAEGVLPSEMVKRAQIERYKTQMLRKLNMFVAKERLVVHNLPASWDDQKLRNLFQKYGGPGAVVKEARIMRDRKNADVNGVGISKQYGFVAFTKHENALAALRNLNNNPNIFSGNKRPIVVFSIENKSAILAKHKRLQKSKLQNQEQKPVSDNTSEKKSKKSGKYKKFLEKKKAKSKNKKPQLIGNEASEFSGVQVNTNRR